MSDRYITVSWCCTLEDGLYFPRITISSPEGAVSFDSDSGYPTEDDCKRVSWELMQLFRAVPESTYDPEQAN